MVGDYIRFADGVERRISYGWSDGVQTTEGGSFYIDVGVVSFSGGLLPSIPRGTLTLTTERKPGAFWFFHHDHAGAHRGVDCTIPCRVWASTLPGKIHRFSVVSLDSAGHVRTGYWYLVHEGGQAHTAFRSAENLLRWLEERGLKLAGELPPHQTHGVVRVLGEYHRKSHMDAEAFASLEPRAVVRSRALCNGRYTLALITEDDGVRTVHTLNPNVKDRPEYNDSTSRALYG